jgi:hypothetical protein
MAKGDLIPFENTDMSMGGTIKFAVNSGTTASINAGEPVQKAAGTAFVALAQTNFPTTTLRQVGVAMSASTETASVIGTVDVLVSKPGQLWLIAPKVAATWNTQAKYNALVGARVLIDLTTAVFTILASDGASQGCVIEYLDISKYPGMVCFSWSTVTAYNNV